MICQRLGWIPDIPDFRDYSRETPAVRDLMAGARRRPVRPPRRAVHDIRFGRFQAQAKPHQAIGQQVQPQQMQRAQGHGPDPRHRRQHHHQHLAQVARGIAHFPRLFWRHGGRFFAHHMAARFQCHQGMFVMKTVR